MSSESPLTFSPTPSATAQTTNPFSSSASPALVLAFLAVGIFAGGFTCMVFLRRYGVFAMLARVRAGRGRGEVGLREAEVRGWVAGVAEAGGERERRERRRRKRRRQVGVRPVLWDVECWPVGEDEWDGDEKEEVGEREKEVGWESVKPLSVSFIRPVPSSVNTQTRIPAQSHASTHPFSRWFTGGTSTSPTFPSSSPQTPTKPKSKSKHPHRLSGHLHVTVAISMPTPEKQRQTTTDYTPVYELGIATLPCTIDKFASLVPEVRPLRNLKEVDVPREWMHAGQVEAIAATVYIPAFVR